MQIPNLKNAKEIAAGGEGKIFEHPVDSSKVIKLYHTKRPIRFEAHLKALSFLSDSFIKPIDIYTDANSVLGFSMEYIDLNDYWLFNNLFNKGFCTTNKIDIAFKTKVLNQLKVELQQLHTKNIVIGDLNQYNLFVSKSANIIFVDVDSYQTKDVIHSGVLLDDIRDWTTTLINEQTDIWAYDILTFWATTFCHPFKWVAPGNKESLEERVKYGKSILSKIKDIKIPPLYVPPIQAVEQQFLEIFKGRRYMVDLQSVHIPIPVIIPKSIAIQTNMSVKHLYDNVSELYCATTQCSIKVDGQWLLVETAIAKTISKVTTIPNVDVVYPSRTLGLYVSMTANTLYDASQANGKQFIKPKCYYADDSLLVVDYATDVMWTFSLSYQLAGIRCTQTPVFAKSIVFRDVPIQNFGASKMLPIPIIDTASLIPVRNTTKNGIYTNTILAVEIKDKRSTQYQLIRDSRVIAMLDYLPQFAVKDNYIFLPRNGRIDVMDKITGAVVTQFSLNICTEASKLYSTISGILLLESNSLYLLNTN